MPRGDLADKAYDRYLEARREHIGTGFKVKQCYKEFQKIKRQITKTKRKK